MLASAAPGALNGIHPVLGDIPTLNTTATDTDAVVKGQPEAESQTANAEGNDSTRKIKVSSTSNPKNVAGSIAHITRAGDPPIVLAAGPNSCNQAIKAVAIARKYLEQDGLGITCQPVFRKEGEINASLNLIIAQCALVPTPDVADSFQIKVKRDSQPAKTAGAIAAKVREGQSVTVSCIHLGAAPVYSAIDAISRARVYLQRDGLDFHVVPEFVHVQIKGEERSALKFVLLTYKTAGAVAVTE